MVNETEEAKTLRRHSQVLTGNAVQRRLFGVQTSATKFAVLISGFVEL